MKVLQFFRFLDSDYSSRPLAQLKEEAHRSSLDRWIPFLLLHAACLLVIWVGYSLEALILCTILYFVRMFAITGLYHRYFSHRSFKTSRPTQFLFACLGATAFQRGPLWWASHHRHHHRASDRIDDVHSPTISGFLWSHMGWITSEKNIPTDYARVPDLAKFPELVFINRFDWLPGTILLVSLFFLGEASASTGLNVSGEQFMVWGVVSTVLVFHGTCSINSLGHMIGSRRFDTGDSSRNNLLLALVTLGEGWHNNHHRYPGSTRQGYEGWELDISFFVIKILEKLGIVWDVTTAKDFERKGVSESILGTQKLKLIRSNSDV